MWSSPNGLKKYTKILRWISSLPYRVNLRINTAGEPFVSNDFLDGAAWISKQANINFVELLTNASLLEKRLDRVIEQGDTSKISLWMTWHHEQISSKKFIEAAIYAKERGVSVVVNSLLFPDSLEAAQEMKKLCSQNNLKFNLEIGHDLPFSPSYREKGLLPVLSLMPEQILSLHRDKDILLSGILACINPKGQLCSAGHDYFFIGAYGNVYPCSSYSRGFPCSKLGNALNPNFLPQLRKKTYMPCAFRGCCGCKEDHFHLKHIRESILKKKSFGWYERKTKVGDHQSSDSDSDKLAKRHSELMWLLPVLGSLLEDLSVKKE